MMLVGDSRPRSGFQPSTGWPTNGDGDGAADKSTCPPIAIPVWSPDQWRAMPRMRPVAGSRPGSRPSRPSRPVAPRYGPPLRTGVPLRGLWTGLAGRLAEMVRRVGAEGARVVVLSPPPRPAVHVPDCLSSNLDEAVACTQRPGEGIDLRGVAAERAAVVAGGGAYVDVTTWFCADNVPGRRRLPPRVPRRQPPDDVLRFLLAAGGRGNFGPALADGYCFVWNLRAYLLNGWRG